MTRLLSPHNYIIYIIYLSKKNFISINISSLSAIIHENFYIKKIFIVIHICLFIYLYNIKIQKLIVTKKISLQPSIYFLYLYLNYYY